MQQQEGPAVAPGAGASVQPPPAVLPPAGKVCPECAEAVKAAAVRCRFCGFDFRFGRSGRPAEVRTISAAAVVSLIFGILWLGGLGSVVAIGCGHLAKRLVDQDPQRRSGRGLAVAGIVLGWLGAAFAVLLLAAVGVPLYLQARQDAVERSTQADLRNALTAAKAVYVDVQDYDLVTPERLAAMEPTLTFTTGASDRDGVVSIFAVDEEFIAAARSASGSCLYIRDRVLDGTSYAERGSGSCSAMSAGELGWSLSGWADPSRGSGP